jgi:glycosyltransferase involved in cell wall biosynthesis
MAVNFVNSLPRERYDAYLCTTRRNGPLGELLRADVSWLQLERRSRFDVMALRRLVDFNCRHDIRILHAHSSSLFVSIAASLFPPHPYVVWHDHFGRFGVEQRSVLLFKQSLKRASGVIAVSQALAEWSRNELNVPAAQVWYIPNFVSAGPPGRPSPNLPGIPGERIVCVANLRPQKDHVTLVRAMGLVVQRWPAAHLLMAGASKDGAYVDLVTSEISRLRLDRNVSLLGERHDIESILQACDIGVLSSISEGLPLSVIEYGMAGLPVVATSVGQCPEMLDDGRAGILVEPGNPERLAEGLVDLLASSDRRVMLGKGLRTRVQQLHNSCAAIDQVCQLYEGVLRRDRSERS